MACSWKLLFVVVVRSSHSCAKIPLAMECHTTIARESLQNVGVCERNFTHNYDVRIVASQGIRIRLWVDGPGKERRYRGCCWPGRVQNLNMGPIISA